MSINDSYIKLLENNRDGAIDVTRSLLDEKRTLDNALAMLQKYAVLNKITDLRNLNYGLFFILGLISVIGAAIRTLKSARKQGGVIYK